MARRSRGFGALGVAFALGAAALSGCAANGSAYGPGWSAVHADAANTDYSHLLGARDLAPAWSRTFDGTINLGATSGPDGRVYVTTTAPGCHLYVLDHWSGETLWCSEAVDKFAVSSAALVDRQGRAFLADSQAMYAFDREGRVLWRTPILGIPLSAQFTPAGRLLFITHIGRIYVLDRKTGEAVLQPVELIAGATFDPAKGATACMRGLPDCPSANTPAIDLRDGRFYFTFWTPGAPNAGIRAMRIREGRTTTITPLWTNDALPGGSGSSPDISADGRRLYLTDNAGALHALDAATGRGIWSFPIGFQSGGSPATSPDGLILPSGGGKVGLMAIRDRGDRAELVWRRDSLANRGVPTLAAGGVAYATVQRQGRENDLVVIDTATGAELDRESLPGVTLFTVGTTIGQDGTVYVPTFRGQIFAFRPAPKAGR